MSNLWKKYKELIVYIFFGAVTTLVNFVVFKLCNVALGEKLYLISNVFAWVAAVVVAYITNKLWVFESKRTGILFILSEFVAFCSGRVLSFFLQEGIFVVFVDLLSLNKMAVKITAGVIVVVVNYILTKLVFKNGAKK